MILLFVLILSFGFEKAAYAVPEVARFGHFTCISCHVSPGGSGVLTAYGRDFSAEKLSSWAFDREEGPLSGVFRTSDQYLLGGDFRWVDDRSKSKQSESHYFWKMQSEIEPGFHYGNLWFTAALGTKPQGPFADADDANRIVLRSYAGRVDLFDEHILIRAGLFMPKYGLMLSDHTAYVRKTVGLGSASEQTQLEAIYQDDRFEATVSTLIESHEFDRKETTRSGALLGLSFFPGKRQRFNIHTLYTRKGDDDLKATKLSLGLSGVFTLTRKVFVLMELDQAVDTSLNADVEVKTAQISSFTSLSFEIFKGLIPYLRIETLNQKQDQTNLDKRRWGLGVNWYARPHIQIDTRMLRETFSQDQFTQDEMTMILHYYI